MILHITFTNGANPVAYCGTPERLVQIWRRISRKDSAARCTFYSKVDGPHCQAISGGGYAVGRYFDGSHTVKRYAYLLPALKNVEKEART